MYTSCLHSCGLVDTNHSDAKESMAAAALNVHFSGPSGPVLMAQNKHLHKEYAHECTWYIEVFGTQTRHSFMVPPFLLPTLSSLPYTLTSASHLIDLLQVGDLHLGQSRDIHSCGALLHLPSLCVVHCQQVPHTFIVYFKD